jgi:aminoglycoside phosphotransferase (APT) family kinase protein
VTDGVDGAPADVVGPWLAAQTGEPAWSTATIALISGGKSNLTYVVSSDAGQVVLRRPPTGHVLATAHDMLRESRVMSALGPTGYPVPDVLAVDETGDLLGAPFYVMSKVEGHIIRDELPPGYADTDADREQIGFRLVQGLADLHAVDYQGAGLAEFGRPTGYLERQVRRWSKQWEATRTAPLLDLDALAADLAARVPERSDQTIVHGDYRLDNTILDPSDVGRISAVLDWEMSTLGDPLADLGLLLTYWRDEADQQTSLTGLTPSVTWMPGFPDRAGVAEAYAKASGRDLVDLPLYVAFGYFKLAVVVQGIVARLAGGAMGGQDFGPMDGLVGTLVDRGRTCLADDSLG